MSGDPFLRTHALLGLSGVRRGLSGLVAVALVVWMAVLFASAPTREVRPIGEDDVAFRVTCDSVAAAGLGPGDFRLDEENTYAVPEEYDGVDSSEVGVGGRESLSRQCQDVRTHRAGFLALLAVPTSVAAAGAVLGGRRRGSTGRP